MMYHKAKINKAVSILITIITFFCFSFFIESSDADDLKGLIRKLESKDPTVRKEVAWKLGEIKDPLAVEPLMAILKEDNDWDVRSMAEDALVKIGAPAVDSLVVALKDEEWRVRTRATRTLGAIKDFRAVDPLITALKKDNVFIVRRFAAQALGEMGEIKDSRAVQILNDAWKNKNLEIVAGAYSFFVCRGEPGSEEVLIEALNRHWTRKMIMDFLNSGNNRLKEAAFELAKRHVPQFKTTIALDWRGPKWGSALTSSALTSR